MRKIERERKRERALILRDLCYKKKFFKIKKKKKLAIQ